MEPIIIRGVVNSVGLDYSGQEQVSVKFDSPEIRERYGSGTAFYLSFPNQGLKLRDEVEMEVRIPKSVPAVIPTSGEVPV